MDSYELYSTRMLLENVMAQAFIRVDQEPGRCTEPGCNFPAAMIFNIELKSPEPGICYDCTISKLKKLAGVPLINQLDESVSNEVEARSITFSTMQKITAEALKRHGSA